MPRKRKGSNWAKALEEIEYQNILQERAIRQAREDKLEAEKDKQIRKNRSKEWTVIWRGAPPQ
jgi:hypothetical protein